MVKATHALIHSWLIKMVGLEEIISFSLKIVVATPHPIRVLIGV
jgi:hypothetical protein